MDSVVNKKPKVTIAIPLHNKEAYIGQTIQSLLDQTFPDFEILVYDNASTDSSVDIIEHFADSRIQVFRNPSNLGAQKNWNRCLSQITGDYFLLMPADDLIHPQYLEIKLDIFAKDQDHKIAIVGCKRDVINSSGRVIMSRGFPGKNKHEYSKQDILKKTFLWGTNLIGEPAAGLVRSDVAKKVGSYRAMPGYLIDLDFWIRALNYGSYYYLDQSLCSFRISDNSWSANIGFNQYRQFMEFIRRLSSENEANPNLMDRLLVNTSSFVNQIARIAFFRIMA